MTKRGARSLPSLAGSELQPRPVCPEGYISSPSRGRCTGIPRPGVAYAPLHRWTHDPGRGAHRQPSHAGPAATHPSRHHSKPTEFPGRGGSAAFGGPRPGRGVVDGRPTPGNALPPMVGTPLGWIWGPGPPAGRNPEGRQPARSRGARTSNQRSPPAICQARSPWETCPSGPGIIRWCPPAPPLSPTTERGVGRRPPQGMRRPIPGGSHPDTALPREGGDGVGSHRLSNPVK